MICNTCRRTLLLTLRASRESRSIQLRTVTTVQTTSNAAPSNPPSSISPSGSSAALSSSKPATSQPLSTPNAEIAIAPMKPHSTVKSSVPGGQELRGLAYLKGKPSITAKEDDEYPSWLWSLLEEGKSGEVKVDLSAMTKKQRHKYDRKQERLMKNVPKQIPLHEQSANLTEAGDDAALSTAKRQELTKSMRVARRKGIRESNFLRGV